MMGFEVRPKLHRQDHNTFLDETHRFKIQNLGEKFQVQEKCLFNEHEFNDVDITHLELSVG